MLPERFQQIEELYHAARESGAGERSALLARANPELRREVESLLAQRTGGEFLDQPPALNAVALLGRSPPSDLATGENLGPYRIEDKLGEGGMGTVYRAIDTRLDRPVAIKVTREQFSERFQFEARAISSLNHPNICTLYDVGPDYLVMELIKGESLSGRLKCGAIPVRTALVFASQMLSALVEAHAKGVIHRDLKPGNIMITKSGIKILDFGLAKPARSDALTVTGTVMGTPAYMAPEQRAAMPVDARADIYSFGCVLYEMLTGARIGGQRKPLPSRRLTAIVDRCLQDDPTKRWQSAAEMERQLSAITDISGWEGRDPATGARTRSVLEFRRPQLWAATCIAAACAVAVALAWQFGHVARASRSGDAAQRAAFAEPAPDVIRSANNPGTAINASVVTRVVPIPVKSIAVLPLENLSGDSENDYFGEGITEEILDALAKIPDLKVAARTSAFAFRSNHADMRTVGKVLGVATVLEGSVQKAGEKVRINVQLVDTHSGYQLWSEKYDRDATNIFAVEDGISNAIATSLRVNLSGGAGRVLAPRHAVDPRAHDFYLRGLGLLAARGPGIDDAVADFRRAVAIDPQYADAWGTLAEAEAQVPFYRPRALEDMLRRAQSSAQRAISLDPDTASAYVALGVVHVLRWQWTEADGDFSHALALAPNDAEAVNQHAQFLLTTGQLEPALREMERAQRLDPLSPVTGVLRGAILTAMHRFDEAEAQLDATMKLHPDFVYVHLREVLLFVDQRRYGQAAVQMRTAAKLDGVDPDAMELLVRGITDAALRAPAIGAWNKPTWRAPFQRDAILESMSLVWLGEKDRALDSLERNLVNRSSIQTQMLWDPGFDPIRKDPRFKAVLRKMGLPYRLRATTSPS